MHWRRNIGIGIVVAAIVAAILYGFRPVPQVVDVATAQYSSLEVAIEEEGRTRVIDRYLISTPVAAYLHRIELDAGDPIRQGQPLAQLLPTPSPLLDPRSRAAAQARVEAARAQLEMARQQLEAAAAKTELAEQEYSRIVDLCKIQCASKEEEDRARTQLRSSRAQQRSAHFAVEVARHELDAAKTALAYAGTPAKADPLLITSPIDGTVLKRLRESEGVVSAATPLLEVGDPARLEVVVDLRSADAVKIAPGTKVVFERWGGDTALNGVVRTVEPAGFTKISALGVEEQRVLVIADITSDPELWQRLGDGYRVDARFILWQADNLLTVPSSSLFRYGDGWALFVMEDGQAKRRAVEIGHRNGLKAQITAGLSEGEQVISHPGETIADGTPVTTRKQ